MRMWVNNVTRDMGAFKYFMHSQKCIYLNKLNKKLYKKFWAGYKKEGRD